MNRERLHILIALSVFSFCLFALASCNLFEDNTPKVVPGEERIYAGIYIQGIEDSDFKPCVAQDEVWKISEIQDTASFFSGLREANSNPVYMELKGVPSEVGEYRGFFMIYDRKIKVKKAVTAANPQDQGCLYSLFQNQ